MRHLSDEALLDLWERGREADAVGQALLLLGVARPGLDEAERRALPLPARDAALLELRIALHGSSLPGRLPCPSCGETLELELDGEQLRSALQAGPREGFALADGLSFRLPTSEDLLAVAGAGDADDASLALARRCCLASPSEPEWASAVLGDIEARMEEQGLAADLQLHLQCQACEHAWTTALDVAAYLWEECEQHALTVLDDVDRLAARYHWSERDILALSPARRRAYLQRCDS